MDTAKLNPNERVEHLARAPIVEAVIDIRAQVTAPLNESLVRATVKANRANLTYHDTTHEYRHRFKIAPQEEPQNLVENVGWKGVRFRSSDNRDIVQFNRDGFVISRLKSYDSWDAFSSCAIDAWNLYASISNAQVVERIGVRFINSISYDPAQSVGDILLGLPTVPQSLGLSCSQFFYQDTLRHADSTYEANLIRTIQNAGQKNPALILDIDVFTTRSFPRSDDILKMHLSEMRVLKNRLFFGSITPKTLDGMR
jgi:uncharacterized protein (TIGR04255 family)